jgi:flavin-dependent dehydrogenase
MAGRTGLRVNVDIFEPRDFTRRGPGNCNMCGGIVSESLVQSLAGEGITLPSSIIQRRIDSYHLHMDVGSVRIPTPLDEKRIAAVHRGSGPRTFQPLNSNSFDAHLLGLAKEQGAQVVPERVKAIEWIDGRPQVRTKNGEGGYDLLVPAVGVNSSLKLGDAPGLSYRPPKSTKAFICEFYLGQSMVKRYLGHAMHIFLLDLPGVEFAAIIPKSDYATVCLLGRNIDKQVVQSFLDTPEVKECMPPLWIPPAEYCHCAPRISVRGARDSFADRLVFVGDCSTTRLYKDGIGAAYRTAKAAAVTAIFHGVSKRDFRRHYWPVCKSIESDNNIGKLVFAVTNQIQRRRATRAAVWKTVSAEQAKKGADRRMSLVLWDIFTGSASYRSVLRRAIHPASSARLLWEIPIRKKARPKRQRRMHMASGGTGALGHSFKDGEVIYHQGDRGDTMYIIQKGAVEVIQRQGDKEFCLAELSKGDFFGEMALFEGETRTATVRAVGDVWVYTLERDSLLKRIHEDPSMAFKLIQQLCYRVRTLERSLMRKSSVAL